MRGPKKPTRFPNLTTILTRTNALPDFLAILRKAGADNPESRLIAAAFFGGAEFKQLFDEGFRPPGRRGADLEYALRQCFGLRRPFPEMVTDEMVFRRWQKTVRNLQTLRPLVDDAAFYGWIRLGVDLLHEFRNPRIELLNRRVAKAVSSGLDRDHGVVWADELPGTLAEFISLHGIGPHIVRTIELELTQALLAPEIYAPTMEEMMAPDFFRRQAEHRESELPIAEAA